MDCFEQVHEAAISAVAELDELCERYDVSYIHYSRVFDSILEICEAAIPKGEQDAEPGEDAPNHVRARHEPGRPGPRDGGFPFGRDEDHEEGHGYSGEHVEEGLSCAELPRGGHLVIVL